MMLSPNVIKVAEWFSSPINAVAMMLMIVALFYHAKLGMQVVMITSATQGEGKTSLAGQLGTSMAGSGPSTYAQYAGEKTWTTSAWGSVRRRLSQYPSDVATVRKYFTRCRA